MRGVCHIGFHIVESSDNMPRAGQKLTTRLSDIKPLGKPLEKQCAVMLLKLRHRLTHRRLGYIKPLRRPAHGAGIGYGYKNFQMPYGHLAHLKNVFLIIAHFKGHLQSYHTGDSINKRSYNAAAQYDGYGADLEFSQYKQRGSKYPEFHYAEIRKACGKDIASEQS